MIIKNCAHCKKEFDGHGSKLYCCTECKIAEYKIKAPPRRDNRVKSPYMVKYDARREKSAQRLKEWPQIQSDLDWIRAHKDDFNGRVKNSG